MGFPWSSVEGRSRVSLSSRHAGSSSSTRPFMASSDYCRLRGVRMIDPTLWCFDRKRICRGHSFYAHHDQVSSAMDSLSSVKRKSQEDLSSANPSKKARKRARYRLFILQSSLCVESLPLTVPQLLLRRVPPSEAKGKIYHHLVTSQYQLMFQVRQANPVLSLYFPESSRVMQGLQPWQAGSRHPFTPCSCRVCP